MNRPLLLSAAAALWLTAAPVAHAHDHSIGVGYRYGHLNTGSDQVYDFHSATVQYAMSIGGWLRFFSVLEVMIPAVGVQNGTSYDLNSTYRSKFGADVSFGGALHFQPLERLFVLTGIGPHMNAMTLSHEELVTFNSLTLGITSFSTARYAINDWLETGANLTVSVDFADPLHTVAPLDWGVHFAVTAIVGVRLGEGDAPDLSEDLRGGPRRGGRRRSEAETETETDETGTEPSELNEGNGATTDRPMTGDGAGAGTGTGAGTGAGTGTVPADQVDEPHGGEGPRPDIQREGPAPTASPPNTTAGAGTGAGAGEDAP